MWGHHNSGLVTVMMPLKESPVMVKSLFSMVVPLGALRVVRRWVAVWPWMETLMWMDAWERSGETEGRSLRRERREW